MEDNKKILISEKQFKRLYKDLNKIVVLGKHKNGFYEITDKKMIKTLTTPIWDILQRSYRNIGGFLTYKTPEELTNKTSLIIIQVFKHEIASCAIYRDYLGGQKMVGCGTANGSDRDKRLLKEIIQKDINEYWKWHWVEVSYPLEKYFKELGGNPIPADMCYSILEIENQSKKNNIKIVDEVHYEKTIRNKKVTKAIYGFKSEEVYNKVMNLFDDYAGFKKRINNTPQLSEEINYQKNNQNEEVAKSMSIIILIDQLNEEGYDEITPNMYNSLKWAVDTLKSNEKTERINNLISCGEYMLKDLEVLSCNTLSKYGNYVSNGVN